MKIVVTNKVLWFKAGAITVWPFIFVHPALVNSKLTMDHEKVHLEQQRRWAIYGLGVGLIAWFLLYLLALPVGWNPFRRKWETEAYKTNPYLTDEMIKEVLKLPPYYLWWIK